MDSQVNDNIWPKKVCCHQKDCISSENITYIDCNSTNSSDYVFDVNDCKTLISKCNLKSKHNCQCSCLDANKPKSDTLHSQPWITFLHILFTAVLALLSVYLTSNILIFENKINGKEMDDGTWRLHSMQYDAITSTSSTTEVPSKNDKCEPLYVLVYAHCCVWFLFLILDHIARHMHHKTLRSRGHLRVYARLSHLAAFPFQLVSLWSVFLAIFLTIYAQQDEADLQPYCDANLLMSPTNGIAVLLIIEFICVTIFSLLYANSVRKFTLEKPPPDICGWGEENNCYDRWTPEALQCGNDIINHLPQSGENTNNDNEHNGKCLLDLLEYYAHANQELAANLGRTSQRLHLLETENQFRQQTSES